MQTSPRLREYQVVLLIGSGLVGVFACAILWEFVLEAFFQPIGRRSTYEPVPAHWGSVFGSTVFAAIGLIFPAVLIRRWLRRRNLAEAALRDYADMASDWLWESDEFHRFARFSQDVGQFNPDAKGRILNITRFDRRHPTDLDDEKWRRHREDLDAHRPFKNFEYPVEVADGSIHHIRVNGRPIFSGDGAFIGYRGTGTDITGQVLALSEMERGEEEFRALLDSAPDSMVITDADGAIVHINGQTEAMFGYDRDELLGKPIEELVPERFRNRHIGHHANFISEPTIRSMGTGTELFGRSKDGREIPVEISLSAIRTSKRRLVAAAVRDITDRKRDEERTRALIAEKDREAQTRLRAETALRDYAEMASDWLWETDEEHRFKNFSAEADLVDADSSSANIGTTRFDRRLPMDQD
ncbi:MAG: PAS domain S-box protein, partial [Rhodospirillales bacterium]|nr:PAS domain S-box protein [Rhodospirillales bacterium]